MALDGATAYITHQPCINCAKELVQAGIVRVRYIKEFRPSVSNHAKADQELRLLHEQLMGRLRAQQVDAKKVLAAYEATVQATGIFDVPAAKTSEARSNGNGKAPVANGKH